MHLADMGWRQGEQAHGAVNAPEVVKRVPRRVLNDGDVIRIGEHEIMYMDERQARTKQPGPNADDDAVPLLDQTMVQDIAEPMEHGETQVQGT